MKFTQKVQDNFHNRWARYFEIRRKIFSELNRGTGPVSAKILKTRQRHKELRNEHRIVEDAILRGGNGDIRPFAEVEIFGEEIKGLLDSGATISVLGLNSIEFLGKHGMEMSAFRSEVRTAGGLKVPFIGKIHTNITFNGRTEPISIYVSPGLSQKLYLGFNFWKMFGLDAALKVEVSEISSKNDDNRHKLTDLQDKELEGVINMFPSSEALGLGKTSILEHVIDTGNAKPVKRRHYPISPAKQKVIYEELNRMISLGVIEESNIRREFV